jgi:hypothetical protein
MCPWEDDRIMTAKKGFQQGSLIGEEPELSIFFVECSDFLSKPQVSGNLKFCNLIIVHLTAHAPICAFTHTSHSNLIGIVEIEAFLD